MRGCLIDAGWGPVKLVGEDDLVRDAERDDGGVDRPYERAQVASS